MCSAALAPLTPRMSGSLSRSADSTMAWIWTSARYPSGNRGRMGRSMQRMVRISFVVGRPSRLKNPPGILPAADGFSR